MLARLVLRWFSRLLPCTVVATCNVGCVNESGRAYAPYQVAISPVFDEVHRAAIVRACARWNDIAGREAVQVNGIEDRERMVIRSAEFPVDGVDAQGFHDEHGVLLVADVYVCGTDTSIRCFEAIVMHELGHLMGVEHVQHGVMQESNVPVDVTDEDRAACARAPFCGGLTSPRTE